MIPLIAHLTTGATPQLEWSWQPVSDDDEVDEEQELSEGDEEMMDEYLSLIRC